jgi:hypothetical protein
MSLFFNKKRFQCISCMKYNRLLFFFSSIWPSNNAMYKMRYVLSVLFFHRSSHSLSFLFFSFACSRFVPSSNYGINITQSEPTTTRRKDVTHLFLFIELRGEKKRALFSSAFSFPSLSCRWRASILAIHTDETSTASFTVECLDDGEKHNLFGFRLTHSFLIDNIETIVYTHVF